MEQGLSQTIDSAAGTKFFTKVYPAAHAATAYGRGGHILSGTYRPCDQTELDEFTPANSAYIDPQPETVSASPAVT